MDKLSKIVPPDFDGANIKSFLRLYAGLSMKLIKKVKWGGVTINGDTVNMRALVHEGDLVEITFISEESDIKPISLPIEVLYEDDYIIAVNKPSNMPTHPARGNSLPTLAEGMAAYMKEPFVFRAINRLDRDTSGIVIIAKNAYSAGLFYKLMREGGFIKKYLCITKGIPREAQGIIDAPIDREREDSIKRVVSATGKRAVTEYRVLEKDTECALLEVTLHTGRTHQIRVHMAHIGTPLYGDFLYGEEVENQSYFLHAKSISFIHPITNKPIEILSNVNFTLPKEIK